MSTKADLLYRDLVKRIDPSRVIFHCDCNGYYASVETVLRPELASVPMAVAGSPDSRHGIILAKNQLAKETGVVTAETIQQAKAKCPKLVLVPPHHELYSKFSRKINRLYQSYTDLVEPFGIDESFLDLSHNWQSFGYSKPADLADAIRHHIKQELGLTISVGVSFNKIFAKLGSDYKKPDATTVFGPRDMVDKIWPLPVSNLLYCGPATVKQLQNLNIKTIGDLALAPSELLFQKLGKHGLSLSQNARGLNREAVSPFYLLEDNKSTGVSITFPHDLVKPAELKTQLALIAEELSDRLKADHQEGAVIQLQLKDNNFKVRSRQLSLVNHTNDYDQINRAANRLLQDLWQGEPVRLLGISAGKLVKQGTNYKQLSLFDKRNLSDLTKSDTEKLAARERTRSLKKVLTEIREEFGQDSIVKGFKQKDQ